MNAIPPPPASTSPLNAVRRHPWRSAFTLLLIAIVALVLMWNWNWLRGPIERAVQASTGREFDIGGDLHVDLGRTTAVRMDRVRFGNAPWSKQGDMATSERVEFRFELFPALFKRDLRIPDLRLTKPRLQLEKGPDGKGNWVFGAPGGTQPQFRNLWVEDGQLKYLDVKGKTDVDIAVSSRAVASRELKQAGVSAPIMVDGSGRWKGNRFTLEGTAQSPLALQNKQAAYRIDLRIGAGPTRAHARGSLTDPLRFRDFNLQLALTGQNMEDLYPLIGVAFPDTPPYSVDGRLTRVTHTQSSSAGASSTWKYDDFSGTVGDSDMTGYAHVTTGPRVFFKADLRSKRLDFDDLAGFVGAAPKASGSEKTNAELQARAARQAASPKLLPDTPYELDKLRAMDADVRLRASRLNAPKLPLEDMDAHLHLKNGVLRLDPLNFGVAGGDIRSTIRMDASRNPIRTDADIKLRRLHLGQLMPDAKLTEGAIGRISGDVDIKSRGNSIAKMLGSANGDIALGMGNGQISNLLVEVAGLDIAEALKFMVTKDRKVPIRCAFGDFAVRNGVMEARALAFDTSDTIFVGEGTVSLRDETLDLRLKPQPKDRSLFALRSPLLIGGTFKDPSFKPDLARVGLRGAIALTLGSIVPPAALLATLELGPGEDAGCGGRYAK